MGRVAAICSFLILLSGAGNRSPALEAYRRANAFFVAQKFTESLGAIEEALHLDPKFIPALTLRAKIAMAAKDFSLARATLERALAIDPLSAYSQFLYGFQFYLQDDLNRARPELEKAHRLNPADPRAALYLARTAEGLGHTAQALALYQETVRLEESRGPPQAETLLAGARLLLLAGKLEDCERWISLAVKAGPDLRDVHYELARLLLRRDDAAGATAQAQAALRLRNGEASDEQIRYLLIRAGRSVSSSGRLPQATAVDHVTPAGVIFESIAARAGLTTWRHTMGTTLKRYIIETNGSGVALLDYDNDGWLDIYLVNGSTDEALNGRAAAPQAALFHNNHDGTFTNVTARAGVTNDRWGFGVAVGDYDNDGWPDLYVSNFGANRLYHNNRDGTFTDVAEKAGVALGNWSTGATFGDYDGDGKLDLFVPGYLHWDQNHLPQPGSDYCSFRGENVMCGPRGLRGEPDHLFHNNGDGTFTDVSKHAGVADDKAFYGMTAVFVDVNNDGRPDLVVANDSTSNYLYLNKGDGTFEDASLVSGFALNQDGRASASMGLAVGGYRNNGLVDFYVGTFSDDYKPLYRNDGDAMYSEVSPEMGIAAPTYGFLTWATGFIDYDNDGWQDLLAINGHVYPEVDRHDWGTSYAQRPYLLRNAGNGAKFEMVPATEGTALATPISGRGAAFGDLFNSGKIDVVVNCMDQVPVLLRNVNPDRHHWVGLKLTGGPKSPKDAVGTTVFLTSGGVRQRADVTSGGSYESSNDQRPHFGLGNATKVDALEIHWPSGFVEHLNLPSVDRYYAIEEGRGTR